MKFDFTSWENLSDIIFLMRTAWSEDAVYPKIRQEKKPQEKRRWWMRSKAVVLLVLNQVSWDSLSGSGLKVPCGVKSDGQASLPCIYPTIACSQTLSYSPSEYIFPFFNPNSLILFLSLYLSRLSLLCLCLCPCQNGISRLCWVTFPTLGGNSASHYITWL